MSILLSTLNARFSHASLGLRYLYANLKHYQEQTEILEFTIQHNTADMLEQIINKNPKIIGFSIYIWNLFETTYLIRELKTLRPDIVIIIGGPEVSHEYENTEIFQLSDYVISGWGDISFYEICDHLLNKKPIPNKVIQGIQPKLELIALPYQYYTDEDIKNRTIYVEASRGCPFKCQFCISSLDKTAWQFPLDPFLAEMDMLYQRGLRQFKFIDRTFNLKKEFTQRILNFFLDKIAQNPEEPIFLHFELVPDYLSDDLKNLILKFPDGSLQFEIGIQSLNPSTQELIARKTDLVKAKNNISWLSHHTSVHLHVDLIAGLPDENLDSFAKGFNELWSWQPQEIQLGVLKRLKGTPISQYTEAFSYKYSPNPPYSVLENKDMSFKTLNHMKRVAKYWDLVANSGRFSASLDLLLAEDAFGEMWLFSDWLYKKTQRTHAIALDRLFALVFDYLTLEKQYETEEVQRVMQQDFIPLGIHGWPKFLGEAPEDWKNKPRAHKAKAVAQPKRQQQHEK